MLQTLRKLLPAKWDDTMQQIWDAKLEAEIEEARKAAGLLKECSSELTQMANGAMYKFKKPTGGEGGS
jgi:hypothetical protein